MRARRAPFGKLLLVPLHWILKETLTPEAQCVPQTINLVTRYVANSIIERQQGEGVGVEWTMKVDVRAFEGSISVESGVEQ
jgi:hypothetical protein